jgi:hypothetical protein
MSSSAPETTMTANQSWTWSGNSRANSWATRDTSKKIAPTNDGSGGAVTDDSQKEHEASTTDFLRPTALEETLARGNHQRSLEKLFSD